MIELTVTAAHKHDIPVAVCGELAGNPDAIERLITLGVDELSVSVGKLPTVRKTASDAEEREALSKLPVNVDIKAPADGEMIPMDEIPDEVFSSGMMGECIGILPRDGIVYAPIKGVVTTIAKAKHAISFKNESVEILVHVGIDTVKLGGEGFTVKVEEGQTVEQGQPVLEFDISKIRENGFNPMVIIAKNTV
jgi:PTS system beta-glucosides-specific IIC component